MHRFWLMVFVLVTAAAPAHAGSTTYDLAYYMGLVTSSGGSTLTDGQWLTTGERGCENDLDQNTWYEDSPTNALLNHTDDTYAMLTSFWYDGDAGGWVSGETRAFAVGADYIEYCAVYSSDGDFSLVPEKRLRFPRYVEVGDQLAVSGPGMIYTSGEDIATTVFLQFFIQKDVITLSSQVPSTLSNCLRVVLGEGSTLNASSHVFILAPGRGFTLFKEMEYWPEDESDSAPLGIVNVFVATGVPYWGTSASYNVPGRGVFTTSGDIASREAVIEALPISTEHTEADRGATVVIPMF